MRKIDALTATIAICGLLGLAGCAPSKPSIATVYSQVNQVFDPKTQSWNERLAFFVQAQNSDGWEDLDRLYLLQDTEEVFYSLTKDTWNKVTSNSDVWIGSQNVVPPPGGSFPTGVWRIELVTRSGEKTNAILSLPPLPITTVLASLPIVSFSMDPEGAQPPYKTTFHIAGMPTSVVVWLKDASGNLIGTQKITSATFQIEALNNDPGIRSRLKSLTFYSYDKTRAQGLIAGPYPLTLKGQEPVSTPVPGARR